MHAPRIGSVDEIVRGGRVIGRGLSAEDIAAERARLGVSQLGMCVTGTPAFRPRGGKLELFR
jgi:cation diffusion facilitator CzcD-associated flavoprotein CzcO